MDIKRIACCLFVCLFGPALDAQPIDCVDPRLKPIDRISSYILTGSWISRMELVCQRIADENERRISNDQAYLKNQDADSRFRSSSAARSDFSSIRSFQLESVERLRYKDIEAITDSEEQAQEVFDTVQGYISR